MRRRDRKCDELNSKLAVERGDRVSNRIHAMWLVRTCLSRPTLSLRSFEEFSRDFPTEETKHISRDRISRVRDGFVEILKGFNRESAATLVARAASSLKEGGRVALIVRHVRDEADMRMKSYSGDDVFGSFLNANLRRGRSPKVQNHSVGLHLGPDRLEWLSELIALARKDRPSIATAIVQCLEEVFVSAVRGAKQGQQSPQALRVLHVLVGDAINTNANASRRALPRL
eukprot:9497474-Pyramimonas_sp.AAC.1